MARVPEVNVRTFRPDIEGLRAIAVLLVVLYHAGIPGIPGGYVGVDAFFVISGFLITRHLHTEIRTTGTLSLRRFYARRAKRLLPLGSVVAIVTVIGTRFWMPLEFRSVSTDALWTGFFGLNVRLAQQGVAYMGNTNPSPLQHYWSLGVEEQFYVVWPLLLLLLMTLGRRRSWTVVAGLVVVIAASLSWSVHETAHAQPLAYFLTPSRAYELAFGALVAVAAPALARLPRPVTSTLSWAGAGALLASGLVLTDATLFPGWAAVWPAAATATVLAAGVGRATGAEALLRRAPFQQIGKVSYGWYLWHWPLLILAPGFLGHPLSRPEAVVVVVVGLWLSIASYIAFEDPLRFLPSLSRPSRAIGMGGSFTGAVLAVGLVAPLVTAGVVGTGAAVGPPDTRTATTLAAAVRTGARIQAVPVNLTPTVQAMADDLPHAVNSDGKSCMYGLPTTTVLGTCASGDPAGQVTVVLTGDSHAYEWYPAVERIALRKHWKLINLTKSGCPLYDTTIYSFEYKRDYTECDAWRTNALKRIGRERPNLIITSAYVASYRGKDYADSWLRGVGTTIHKLRTTGAPVVSIQDTPWPNFDVPSCVADHLKNIQKCSFDRAQLWADQVRRKGTAGAAKAAGAVVIDPTSWFCTAKRCPAVIGNTAVYHDTTHMTATYATRLTPLLEAALPAPRR